MGRLHVITVAALSVALGCAELESSESGTEPRAKPRATIDDGELIRVELAAAEGLRIVGVAPPPPAETGHHPTYELIAESKGGDARAMGIEAIDAALDETTQTLAWIEPDGTLYTAPVAKAPRGKREAATRAIVGLAARSGRVAFAVRVNGPETSPFVLDLRTGELLPLDGGPGPDEILEISPSGDSVLLLSGRTGLASLFEASASGEVAVQLTNVGLSPGRDLDTAAFVPAPVHHRDVTWERNGIAFRTAEGAYLIDAGGRVQRIDRDAPIEEMVR